MATIPINATDPDDWWHNYTVGELRCADISAHLHCRTSASLRIVSIKAEAVKARDRAAEIVRSSKVANPLVRNNGEIEMPIPVVDANRKFVSWFVPVALETKLIGFVQLGTGLEFLRYSTFQRDPKSLEGCPDLSAWQNPDRIIRRARERVPEGLAPNSPYMTYDRNPSRLVWAVEFTGKEGQEIVVLVAGEYAYVRQKESDV